MLTETYQPSINFKTIVVFSCPQCHTVITLLALPPQPA
jgi:hypothetical protein